MADDRILVVDDDPAIVELCREILEVEGFQADSAANGAEALERVREAPPSLVILDKGMPVMDGVEFVNRLQDMEIRIPIVVLSAGTDSARWAREIEAASFVAKPFDMDHLIAEVRRVLAARDGSA